MACLPAITIKSFREPLARILPQAMPSENFLTSVLNRKLELWEMKLNDEVQEVGSSFWLRITLRRRQRGWLKEQGPTVT